MAEDYSDINTLLKSLSETEFVEMLRMTQEDIARSFRIPPRVLGIRKEEDTTMKKGINQLRNSLALTQDDLHRMGLRVDGKGRIVASPRLWAVSMAEQAYAYWCPRWRKSVWWMACIGALAGGYHEVAGYALSALSYLLLVGPTAAKVDPMMKEEDEPPTNPFSLHDDFYDGDGDPHPIRPLAVPTGAWYRMNAQLRELVCELNLDAVGSIDLKGRTTQDVIISIENLDHMMMHNGKRPSMGRVKAADLKKQKINRLAADITFAAFKIEEARQMMIAGVHHSVIISRLRLRFPT